MCFIFVAQINVICMRPLYEAVILCDCIINLNNLELMTAIFILLYLFSVIFSCFHEIIAHYDILNLYILAHPTGISVHPIGARKCCLTQVV